MADLTIEVTLDNMTFGDYERLQGSDYKKLPLTEQLDLLDKFVVGDVRDLPLSAADDIVAAIEDAVKLVSSGN
jgi:hypothetical protein